MNYPQGFGLSSKPSPHATHHLHTERGGAGAHCKPGQDWQHFRRHRGCEPCTRHSAHVHKSVENTFDTHRRIVDLAPQESFQQIFQVRMFSKNSHMRMRSKVCTRRCIDCFCGVCVCACRDDSKQNSGLLDVVYCRYLRLIDRNDEIYACMYVCMYMHI